MPVEFKSPGEAGPPCDGVLDWEDDCLVVEYERARFLRSPEVVCVDIPVEEIDDVEFRPRLFSGKLTVRLMYLETAKRIEWCNGLEIKFVIPKKETDRAIALIDSIDANPLIAAVGIGVGGNEQDAACHQGAQSRYMVGQGLLADLFLVHSIPRPRCPLVPRLQNPRAARRGPPCDNKSGA